MNQGKVGEKDDSMQLTHEVMYIYMHFNKRKITLSLSDGCASSCIRFGQWMIFIILTHA